MPDAVDRLTTQLGNTQQALHRADQHIMDLFEQLNESEEQKEVLRQECGRLETELRERQGKVGTLTNQKEIAEATQRVANRTNEKLIRERDRLRAELDKRGPPVIQMTAKEFYKLQKKGWKP